MTGGNGAVDQREVAARVGLIVAAAEQSAEELRSDAETKASERIAEADRAAEFRVAAAEEEAREIIEAALVEARRAQEEATEKARETVERARRQAREIISAANSASDSVLADTTEISDNLRDLGQSLRNNAERLLRDMRAAHGSMTGRLDRAFDNGALGNERDDTTGTLEVPEFAPTNR